MSGLEKHRVAITVMCEAEGADYMDASHVAEFVIRGVLREVGEINKDTLGIKVEHSGRHRTLETTVHEVIDTGVALGNCYFVVKPGSKAFPREDES